MSARAPGLSLALPAITYASRANASLPNASLAVALGFRFHVYSDMPPALYADYRAEWGARDWSRPTRDTPQHSLERYLADLLPLHPCHTNDSSLADAFFVPAQTSTARILSFVDAPERQSRHNAYSTDVERWLETAHGDRWRAAAGTDHWVVGWPVNRGQRESESMNLIGPELADPFAAPYRLRPDRYYRHALDVVTPYPDPLAYATLTDDYFAQHPRDGLVVFAGNVHAGRDPAHWRQQMRDLFAARDDPRVVWHEMSDRWELSTDIYAAMARADFGVVLEGDSLTSRRLFTLIQAGTIPVLLVDDLVLPFESSLDWDTIAISLPVRRVFNDPSFDFIRYLEDIPIERRERMRAAGRAARHALTFHDGRIEPGDAVDLIVEQMAIGSFASRNVANTLRRTARYGDWAASKIDSPSRADVAQHWLNAHGVLSQCVIFGKRCARWAGL